MSVSSLDIKQEFADFLILDAFGDLEGDGDMWLMMPLEWRYVAAEYWNEFDINQRTAIRKAAAYVAWEIHNGLFGFEISPFDIINNAGPYPLDIMCLMDKNMSAQEMESLWKGMVRDFELDTYGFEIPEGVSYREVFCRYCGVDDYSTAIQMLKEGFHRAKPVEQGQVESLINDATARVDMVLAQGFDKEIEFN